MRKILCIVLLFSVFTVFAQKDPKAEKVLMEVEKHVKSLKSIKTDFEYTISDASTESTENYNGNVIVKGKKFRMALDKTITFCDGKTRWVLLEESNEVNVSSISDGEDLEFEERFLIDPLSIFSMYKEGFKYIVNSTNEQEHVIDLVPEDLKVNYFKIRCWFNNNKQLTSLKYFLKDGTRMVLHFKNWEEDIKVSENELLFNEKSYPGVEVIDLRD